MNHVMEHAESRLVEDHINQWQFAASEISAADKGREDPENRYGEKHEKRSSRPGSILDRKHSLRGITLPLSLD